MGRMIRVSKATLGSAPAAPWWWRLPRREAQASASIRSNSISRKLSRRSTPITAVGWAFLMLTGVLELGQDSPQSAAFLPRQVAVKAV